MKRGILLSFLCVFLMCSTTYAQEETYIVQLKNDIQLFMSESAEQPESRNYVTATYEELQEYLDAGIVEYYEPDYEVKLLETFASEDTPNMQWNLETINISKPWNIGCYGNDVVVGVIDSGCYAHPALANNLLPGKNYTSANKEDTTDNIGHGTYVSGIIASESKGEYIDGIAHKAKIIPLKCFDNNVTTRTSMISDAIYDAIDLYGCDIINLSLGIPKSMITKTLEKAVNYAINNGCILVAAVGNDGAATEYYPAKYDNVIGVGAVNKNGEVSSFSQYNSTVDFVAPGEGVKSVTIDGFNFDSGTSYAAPHIAALAAIAKCIDEDITPQEFTEILINTSHHPNDAEDLEKQHDVYYGYGIVDAEGMFDELLKGTLYFVSPVTHNITKIYNNSSSCLFATGIVATYDDDKFENIVTHNINLGSGEITELACDPNNKQTHIMLWDLLSLKPLYHSRELIAKQENSK